MRIIQIIGRVLFAFVAVLVIYGVILIVTRDGTEPEISPDLEQYVQKWKSDMAREKIPYKRAFNRIGKIILVETKDSYAGVTDLSTACIKINSRQRETGEMRMLCTVYHELGHFVFRLEHDCCEIMTERCPSEEYLQENWVELQQEYLEACKAKRFESNN